MTVLDSPDIVSRVFRLKLKALEKDLYTNGVFGRTVGRLRVVEFQKRGLPHAHILIILEGADAPRSVDDWGSFVLNISDEAAFSGMVGHDLKRLNF